MRTNHAGVTEKAEFNVDREKYKEGYERIFGKKPSPFCDTCEERKSYCKCEGEENEVE
jgi:hypothetical protein